MENTFYLGSYMFLRSESMRDIVYIFSGARKTENGWLINISMTVHYGYAGGTSTFNLEVKPGDTIRLAPKTKAYVKESSSFKEKTKQYDVSAMRIEQIEADMLKVTFE